ncbi:MAG: TldD/PmbA family protein [Proteobacteria bacterium]|nr:TldD/PmbA family protein [Pseudomonadota bacterium]MBU1741027.1 TldD/PmbA family protein [Pseudomonadota bacterium]
MAESIPDNLKRTAELVLKTAKGAGADQASARVARTREMEVSFRGGDLEKARGSTRRQVSVRLFVAGRYGGFSTSDLRPGALGDFVKRGVELVRALEPDPHRGLPDPKRYASGKPPDLGLYDPRLARARGERFIARAAGLDRLIKKVSSAGKAGVISTSGYAGFEVSAVLLADTNGFAGLVEQTTGYVGCGVVLLDPTQEGKRRRDGWTEIGPSLKRLGDKRRDERTARLAYTRAVRQIGAKPGPTGRASVVVENQAAGKLVRSLVQILSGPALRRRTSFLLGKKGRPVAAKILTLKDEPWLSGGLGSRRFDAEGVAVRPMPLIEAGVLKNYYLDTYNARVLKMKPTTGRPTNLVLTPSVKAGFRALWPKVKRGLAVTDFLGGNFNATTGDFSYGVSGLWIEGGEAVYPVEGMNLSGNYLDLWKSLLAVGNDPYPFSRFLTPSLVFGSVQFSGAGRSPGPAPLMRTM